MAYFRAFCKVSIIREALRKARFSCMETYLLFSLTGEKVDGRKISVGFRLWIRCHRLWHWDCCQRRPQLGPLDTRRGSRQWIRCLIRKTKRSEWIMKCFIIFFICFFEKIIALSLGQCCIINSTGGDGIGV